jgi:carbamoyl-phosphate synthase large subunit
MHEALSAMPQVRIPSFIEGDFDEVTAQTGLPCLLKPRRSSASKGICRIENRRDFDYWRQKIGQDFMVQPIVGDDAQEFTAAVFGYGDGTASASIVFLRRLSREGATSKAQVVRDTRLDELIARLVAMFRPVGPTNFQFRLCDDGYKLLEINPRVSSSTSMRALLGVNEAKMCVEFYCLGCRPQISAPACGVIERYVEDHVV